MRNRPDAPTDTVTDRARTFMWWLLITAIFLCFIRSCVVDDATTVATFNIEEFPKSERQVAGAFETIEELDATIVALQEIGDTAKFERGAADHLGPSWRTIWPDADLGHTPGLLYDADVYDLKARETHYETVVCRGCKPVLEAQLEPNDGGELLTVYSLHLKAYDEGLDIRRRQYRALRKILHKSSPDGARRVVLGDFNSTRDADRKLLEQFAEAADLRWTTRNIDCTGYWKPDERCRGTTLDHLLADGPAPAAVGRGPCESVGCKPGGSCPVFFHAVSDHCPVTVTLPPP